MTDSDIKIFCDFCSIILDHQDISIIVDENQFQKPQQGKKDYCVRCFCSILKSKKEKGQIEGRYYVRTPNVYSISEKKWRVSDDISLIEGIREFGYGQWSRINLKMVSDGLLIRQNELREHFMSYYKENNHNLLNTNEGKSLIGNSNQKEKQIKRQQEKQQGKEEDRQIRRGGIQNVSLENHLIKWCRKRLLTLQCLDKEITKIKNKLEFGQVSEDIQTQGGIELSQDSERNLPLYTAERDQFLVQHDPYAESVLADLQFGQNESCQEMQIKQSILVNFNKKLRERKKRRIVALNSQGQLTILSNNLLNSLTRSNQNSKKQTFFLNKAQKILQNKAQKILQNKAQKIFLNNGQQIFQNMGQKISIDGQNAQVRDESVQIGEVMRPFIRLFESEQQMDLTKTLIVNYQNLKEIINTVFHIKKHHKNKLSSFKQLKSFLQSTIKPQQQLYNPNQSYLSQFSHILKNIHQPQNHNLIHKKPNQHFIIQKSKYPLYQNIPQCQTTQNIKQNHPTYFPNQSQSIPPQIKNKLHHIQANIINNINNSSYLNPNPVIYRFTINQINNPFHH